MFAHVRAAIAIFALLSALTGLAYPLVVTGIAEAVFHDKAHGSLIADGDRIVGSALIGQSFDEPGYFWSRPSATAPAGYNAGASSGSNLGPTNRALLEAVKDRVERVRDADPANDAPIPVDLVTASASGLDPHISPAAAEYQIGRVARTRKLDVATIRKLVTEHTAGRTLGLLGEPRVNVLLLNRALDRVHNE